jgi:hypothetical protein
MVRRIKITLVLAAAFMPQLIQPGTSWAKDSFLVAHPAVKPSAHLTLRGVPAELPKARRTITAADLLSIAKEKDPQSAVLAGTPKCDVHIYSLRYHSIGGSGERIIDSTAVMIPSGTDPVCSGRARPTVLLAHGTSVDRNYDLASLDGDINGQNEGLSGALFFAAQGMITIIPNYAGYAGSSSR